MPKTQATTRGLPKTQATSAPLPPGVTLSAGDLTAPAALENKDQWAVLAGLRFLLAFTVLGGHCASYIGVAGLHQWCDIFLRLNQGSAVYGFLVVSGYSIGASLRRNPNTAKFYERRINRIYPVYLASLLFAVIVSAVFGRQGPLLFPNGHLATPADVTSVIGMLFMLQVFVFGPISADGQSWSLALEWWLYMVAPALNSFKRRMNAVTVAVIAASFYYYFFIAAAGGTVLPGQSLYGLQIAMLAWIWLTGFMYQRYKPNIWATALLVFPTMVCAYFGRFTAMPMIASLFVIMVCDKIPVPRWATATLLWLGDLSYPLYLFHIGVICLLFYFHVTSTVIWAAGSIAASIVVLHAIDYPTRGKFRLSAAAKA